MQTPNSKKNIDKRIIIVIKPFIVEYKNKLKLKQDIKKSSMCPATIFAVKRKNNAKGAKKNLNVSI